MPLRIEAGVKFCNISMNKMSQRMVNFSASFRTKWATYSTAIVTQPGISPFLVAKITANLEHWSRILVIFHDPDPLIPYVGSN